MGCSVQFWAILHFAHSFVFSIGFLAWRIGSQFGHHEISSITYAFRRQSKQTCNKEDLRLDGKEAYELEH